MRNVFILLGLTVLLAAAAFGAATDPPDAKAPTYKTMAVWNSTKGGGNGFANDGHRNQMQTSIGLNKNEGRSGKGCIEWSAAGTGWINGGWIFADPKNPVSAPDMTHLTFWAKAKGKMADAVQIRLDAAGDENAVFDKNVPAIKYCPKLADDGAWQEVSIPFKDLRKDGAATGPKSAWRLTFITLDEVKGSFLVDDISFDDRK